MVYPDVPQATVAEVEHALGRSSVEWGSIPPADLIAAVVKVTDAKRNAEMQRRAYESLHRKDGDPSVNG